MFDAIGFRPEIERSNPGSLKNTCATSGLCSLRVIASYIRIIFRHVAIIWHHGEWYSASTIHIIY